MIYQCKHERNCIRSDGHHPTKHKKQPWLAFLSLKFLRYLGQQILYHALRYELAQLIANEGFEPDHMMLKLLMKPSLR